MKSVNQIIMLATVLLIPAGNIAIADARDDAISICKAAEQARQAAIKVKMEWTKTKSLIKSGKAALEKGEFDTAIKACAKAKFQGEASVKQAALESKSWQARVPQ